MEKMTSGCYGGMVNSWGCNWVGLVHNKEPASANIPSAALSQHDYESTRSDGMKKRTARNSHSKRFKHNTIMAKP